MSSALTWHARLLLFGWHHRDDAHHRRAEVASGRILDPTTRPGRNRLMVVVEMRMESAIKHERSGPLETKGERARSAVVGVSAQQELVGAIVTSGVEKVITHHRVVVGVHIDPLHHCASANRQSEWSESVFSRHDDLPV